MRTRKGEAEEEDETDELADSTLDSLMAESSLASTFTYLGTLRFEADMRGAKIGNEGKRTNKRTRRAVTKHKTIGMEMLL